jgi:hypothetical protein
MELHSLEDSIRLEQELVDAIKQNTRHHSGTLLKKLVLTFALPYLVFMAIWIVTNQLRANVALQYDDTSLNTTSMIASVLVLITATLFTWRWAEKRFGGLALVGRLVGVSKSVLNVERQIDTVKQKPTPSEADAIEIERLAYATWEQYTQAMQDSGVPIKHSN